MNRSSVVILAILIFLAGVSIYVYKSKSRLSTVDEDARNFSFKDTAAITKIFIADKEGDHASVERTKDGWMVNGKYHCRSEAILNLLEVIKHVDVKMPVQRKARESIIRFMASTALKVEIYAGTELVKQYYVGHETLDSEGSFMLLTDLSSGKNYPDPYVCFIPGFQGFLQPRYIAKENEWRDRVVINYIPPQIRQIKVMHHDAPADSSFTIELLNTTTFKLKDHKDMELPFDMVKMKQYLAYFQNISYEVLITGMNKHLQDSLATQKPFMTISVTTTDFKTSDYKFYHKQFLGDVNPELGFTYKYDPDRLYMRFAQDKEWALVQYFVFGKLFTTRDYFLPVASVKK
jgi:hypothetical protein